LHILFHSISFYQHSVLLYYKGEMLTSLNNEDVRSSEEVGEDILWTKLHATICRGVEWL
jgi:hypothetical protein